MFAQVCLPQYVAKCAGELPENPGGSLGVFTVTVPTGTVQIDADAFTACTGLAQVTLPATVTVIAAGTYTLTKRSKERRAR